MRLYHYTSEHHAEEILRSRHLRTTESNVSLTKENAGPLVVWLTTEATPTRYGHGLSGSLNDKRAVRFTVEVDDARSWRAWARAHGMSRHDERSLIEASGGGEGTWRVVERPIALREWVEVRRMATGDVLIDTAAVRDAAGRQAFGF